VNLIDYDDLSSDDVECRGQQLINSRRFEEWDDFDGKFEYEFEGESSEGYCKITFTVKAVNGP
jgi:hypothetical protein